MRVAFVVSDLEAGGSQRVAIHLARHWSEIGWVVDLVTLAGPSTDFFDVPDGVARVCIEPPDGRSGLRAVVFNNRDRLVSLRSFVARTRPDVVVSFLDSTNVLVLAATRFGQVPVVVSERNDPRRQPLGFAWRLLRRLLYPRAGAIVVQTQAVRGWATARFDPSLVEVIPNPVELPARRAAPDPSRPLLVGMGRLTHQKGFDVLIEAFHALWRQSPGWTLTIVGEGPDRSALEAKVAQLGLDGVVDLVGRREDVEAVLSRATMFALSSRYEGFPNVLLEAMAFGLACISTDCPSGPSEIISDRVDGVLVPVDDVQALSTELCRLGADAETRRELGDNARQRVSREFSLAVISAQWQQVLQRVSS